MWIVLFISCYLFIVVSRSLKERCSCYFSKVASVGRRTLFLENDSWWEGLSLFLIFDVAHPPFLEYDSWWPSTFPQKRLLMAIHRSSNTTLDGHQPFLKNDSWWPSTVTRIRLLMAIKTFLKNDSWWPFTVPRIRLLMVINPSSKTTLDGPSTLRQIRLLIYKTLFLDWGVLLAAAAVIK